MNTILVTGASGQLGSAVTKYLLKNANSAVVKIFARDTFKVSELASRGVGVRVGDYDDYDSLINAFKGIDKLYLVSGTDIGNRGTQQLNAVNAAKEAGVKHILYTSIQRTNETETSPVAFLSKSHLDTERAIRESGMIYTILQDSLYADVVPFFAGQQVLETKTLNFPAKNGKVAFATRENMAEASANILLDETGKYDNVTLELTGAEAVSWQQVAQIIASASGVEINYNSPSVKDYEAALRGAQVPQEFVLMLSGFARAIAEGEFEHVSSHLADALGRKPASLESFLSTVYKK